MGNIIDIKLNIFITELKLKLQKLSLRERRPYRRGGVVVRAYASQSVDLGFIS